MKIQNYSVIFIVIIMPIALILSIYTGNLIDVANKQSQYDALLLGATYDAVRAYQMNTLNNSYDSESNSKVRDINASINSFFNSLAAGMSQSGLTKNELTDYVPAMLYTLYDGYYVYGVYNNVASTKNGISYDTTGTSRNNQYGLKPYVYYSCEYASSTAGYDLIVNYTLDNYITVTGTYTVGGVKKNIAMSGYYINTDRIKLKNQSAGESASFDDKIVTIDAGTSQEITIKPEQLGEYLIAYDQKRESGSTGAYKNNLANNSETAQYYQYITYNNVKYYLDSYHVGTQKTLDGNVNTSFNMTYDNIPIFHLDKGQRIYINDSTLSEIKSFLGVVDDNRLFSGEQYKDVNAYQYYARAYTFSSPGEDGVYDALSQINLANNVVKTDTYNTTYNIETNSNQKIETHTKNDYKTKKVFDYKENGNDPDLETSSFNQHRMDVIISSIESSLVSIIASFNSYTGGTYEYLMPTFSETEWERICSNITVVSFLQGLTVGNYKYYNNYSIVANTKVKDYISKESIYVQKSGKDTANTDYHNPRCETYNTESRNAGSQTIVGYRNIDYDRKSCVVPSSTGNTNDSKEYWYYLQNTTGAYECVVNQNGNTYTTDELFRGTTEDNKATTANSEIRRAYITALARERGSSYKTYGYLNKELQRKEVLAPGQSAYTVRYFYKSYDESKTFAQNKASNNYAEQGRSGGITNTGTIMGTLPISTEPANDGYYFEKIQVVDRDGNVVEEKTRASQLTTDLKVDSRDNEIRIYYNIQKEKTLTYKIERYVFNKDTSQFDKASNGDVTVTKSNVWINASNTVEVNLPGQYGSYGAASLVYTDPTGYEEGIKTIEAKPSNVSGNAPVIKAYYARKDELYSTAYTVRYHANANGTSGTMNDSSFKFFEKATLIGNRFSKTGYKFINWKTNSGKTYSDREGIIIGNADNADLVREGDKYYLDLYAQWDKISYQISYQSNGATSETMENSTHYYDTESKINKNKYVKEYNVTINPGIGSTNYYKNRDEISAWGSLASVSYDEDTQEYSLTIMRNAAKYSGMYYNGKDAVLKPGETAVISYDVYPKNSSAAMILEIHNSIVGQTNGNSRVDQSGITPESITIPANTWTTVSFTYTNNSKNDIYDYSVLSIDSTNGANFVIKNPRFEITNFESELEATGGKTQYGYATSTFLNWKNNNKIYKDEQNVLNLTTTDNEILSFEAQWKDYELILPKAYKEGCEFIGWFDQNNNKYAQGEKITITQDMRFTAKWDDSIAPETELTVTGSTTHTITVDASATDYGAGMEPTIHYIYYIKEKGEPDSKYVEHDAGANDTYTFTNLKKNTEYTMKVRAIADQNGNEGTATTDGMTLDLSGEIIATGEGWTKNDKDEGTYTVKFVATGISGEDIKTLYIETRKDGETEYRQNDTVYGVEHNQTAYGRLTDGTDIYAEAQLKAVDNKNPKIEIKDITATADKTSAITVEIKASDDESGLGENPIFTYFYKKHGEADYRYKQVGTATTEKTMKIEGTEPNSKYDVKVVTHDRAGNEGSSVETIETGYTYNIIFDGNGATSGTVENMLNLEQGKEYTLNKNEFERTGYNLMPDGFVWKIRNSNPEIFIKDEAEFRDLLGEKGTITLEARWIDNIPPTIESLTRSTTDKVSDTTGLELTGEAQDLGTGVVGQQISTDGNLNADSGGWTTITATNEKVTFTKQVYANATYYYYVKDGAGNVSKKSITVDNIKPKDIEYGPNSDADGKRYYEWTATATGNYEITLQGAGGAPNFVSTQAGDGSWGGIVTLKVYVEAGAKLYFVVGDKGNQVDTDKYWNPATGGYNGGGNGGKSVTVKRSGHGEVYHKSMKAGNGGGGATTMASSLAGGNGQLSSYENATNAAKYILGAAAGGGGNSEINSYVNTKKRNGYTVNGGASGAGSSEIFGRGTNARDYSGYKWREYTGTSDDVPNSTEGADGGGAGWYGGWANTSDPKLNQGRDEQCIYTKTSGEGGSNYSAVVGSTFTTSTGKTAKIISSSQGVDTSREKWSSGHAKIHYAD